MRLLLLLLSLLFCSPSALRLKNRLRARARGKMRHRAKNKAKEEMALSIEDLQYLTDSHSHKVSPHKKRYTKDGRACATAFAFNGQVYHDCTDGTSPDNKNTGEEWCYVDANAGGSPNWGYCKPVLDYDAVRRKVQSQYIKMTVEARKVDHLVEAQIMPTSKLTQMVAYVKNKQLAVDAKLNVITNQVKRVNDNYQILVNLKEQYEALEVEIAALKTELESLEAKKEAGDGKDPNNCEGMLGYENEGPGDGVTASYYDNEDFMGEPEVTQVDNQVDFQWENEEPASGVNQDNFSIKWSAWLRVPVNGKYNFYTESDDGNQLLLNGKPIITHFWSQTNKEGGNWLDSHIGNLRKNMKPGQVETNSEAGLISAQSFPVSLEGGNKYKLEFHMYHSVHNEEHDSGQAFAKLFWENQYMQRQIISQTFLYTQNKVPPIKLFNYDPKMAQITEVREDDLAFLNNEQYRLQDVPFQFQGASGLKTVKDWPYDDFKFSVNGAIILYVVASSTENPLPEGFKFTGDVVSLMKVNPKEKPVNGKVKALSSTCYFIYKKQFSAGDHSFDLAMPKEGKNHLMVFYTPDPGAGATLSCGGEEVQVSLPSNPDFGGCSESSRYNQNGWGCDQGFAGKMEDSESALWATDSQGVGAFLELTLKNPYQITKLQIRDRNNAVERNSKIEVRFDGGETRLLTLKNLDSIQNFKVEPAVITKSVRFTIKQVFSMGNNGGAFNVFGTPCMDPKKLDNPENDEAAEEPKELTANCEDTILSSKFQAVGLKPDMTVMITCEDACMEAEGNVYGDLEYSEDSLVCKAAFHAGAIDDKGGQFKLEVKAGKFEYKGAFRSGMQSKSKQGNSLLTLAFEKSQSAPDISEVLKQGMKIDIFDDGLKQWMAASIESMERVSATSAKLVVAKDNMPEDSKESLTWPNPDKLDFCGKKVNKRDCGDDAPAEGGSSRLSSASGATTVKATNLKICFGIKGAPQGYILDSGEKFGEKSGFSYGWTMDNSKALRIRAEGEGIENQLILFPPSPKSTFCQDPNPKFSCAENAWKAKVQKGSYQVRLVMGDKKQKSQYDFAINGIKFASGKILRKDQFYSEEKKVKVSGSDPFIKISTKCQADNCDYSWSRLSSIEITSVAEDEKVDSQQETVQSGCGEAFEGGRCDQEGANIENCLFKKEDHHMNNCFGMLHLVDVDHAYFCKDQVGKYKCIKKNFKDQTECEKKCPGKCKAAKCLTKPKPPSL